MMTNKKEWKQVKHFFATHPHAVKYSRKESGFDSSYIKDPSGHITRLYNKSEFEPIVGEGAFGRVKKIESHHDEAVMKIQTVRIRFASLDDLGNLRDIYQQEALINLDFGIAKGALIERAEIFDDVATLKFYQEMYRLENTLESQLDTLTANERMKAAIDALLLINDCHNGALTLSGHAYMHGDISLRNIMYDKQGNMRLIDFATSKRLESISQLEQDQEAVMDMIFNQSNHPLTTYDEEHDETQFPLIPHHVQRALSWQHRAQLPIEPQSYLTFIAALLITYADNPDLSQTEIHALIEKTYQPTIVVESYRRKNAVLKLSSDDAQYLLRNTLYTLNRYEHFIERKWSNFAENPTLIQQKRHAISHILHSVKNHTDQSPQALLALIDNELILNETLLSAPLNHTSRWGLGCVPSGFSSSEANRIQSLINTMDEKIHRNSTRYRAAVKEQIRQSSIVLHEDDDILSRTFNGLPK